MKVLRQIPEVESFTREARQKSQKVGFVPTMGALHQGHLSLVKQARSECDKVVVSVFVNPLQFGPGEDLDKYPRTFEADKALLEKEQADVLFYPTPDEIYPEEKVSKIAIPGRGLTDYLCGPCRPGHFEGVVTVVARLFEIVCPDVAYFGAKDFQQGRIIQEMVKALGMQIDIKLLPIVRDSDGLALSSRNQYLSSDDRARALALPRTLNWFKEALATAGDAAIPGLLEEARERLAASVNRVDYFDLVDADSLQPVAKKEGRMLAAAACFVGQTRLIDNVIITP